MSNPLLGQIGLIPRGKSFVARGIELVTRSPVYHVVICVSDTTLVEAQPGGAVESPLTKWPTAIWSHFPLTDEQAQGSAQWAIEHKGVPYNFIDDAAIGIGCLFGYNSPTWVLKRLSDDCHLQCAQMGDMALALGAGYRVFTDGRLSGAVYPGSFVPIFKENGWWTE